MELMLQFGHGMMAHSIELIKKWQSGTVVFSPRNMSKSQMEKTAASIQKNNGKVLIDPQFYIPRTKIENLFQHSFWPSDYNTNSFFSGNGLAQMLGALNSEYNEPLQTAGFIIPSLYIEEVSSDWTSISKNILESVLRLNIRGEKYFTLCISDEILLSEDKTNELIEEIEDFPVDGFYIIPIHKQNEYLVESQSWLLNLMELVASIKLLNKKAIVGYSSHQLLLLSLSKVDAICAGTWLKTRIFPIGDYTNDEEANGGRRTVWYYCPQALTEYQVDTLNMAKTTNCLSLMKTPDSFDCSYSNPLFEGPNPSDVDFPEPFAFRHYLCCLRTQCASVTKPTYMETNKYLHLLFEIALDLTTELRRKGVRGKYKDFNNVAETNIGCLDAFDSLRGFVFNKKWTSI